MDGMRQAPFRAVDGLNRKFQRYGIRFSGFCRQDTLCSKHCFVGRVNSIGALFIEFMLNFR
jgi:hypothetical protein